MRPRKSFIIFFAGACLVFGVFIYLATSLIASPETMKIRQRDDKRTEHLKSIIFAANSFYAAKKVLPKSFEEMGPYARKRLIETDPYSDEPYKYIIINRHQIEVCATFGTENLERGHSKHIYLNGISRNLDHKVGENCFSIDLDESRKR